MLMQNFEGIKTVKVFLEKPYAIIDKKKNIGLNEHSIKH